MAFKLRASKFGNNPMRKNFPHVFKKVDEFGEYINDAGTPVKDPAAPPQPRAKSRLRDKIDAGRVRRKTRKAKKLTNKAANLRDSAANDPRSRRRADRLERRATNKEKRAGLKESQAKNIAAGKDKMANVTDDRTTMQALRGGKNVTFGDKGRKGEKTKTKAVIGDVAPENKAKKPVVNNNMSFSQAFRAARNAGQKEFTWKGKRYHTRTKSEDAKSKNVSSKTKGMTKEKYNKMSPEEKAKFAMEDAFKMTSPNKIDLNFSGGQKAKSERDATAKREFLKKWNNMTAEEKAKVPKPVRQLYGV